MRTLGVLDRLYQPAGAIALGAIFLLCAPVQADDIPKGAPLVLSMIETEQSVPLAILAPDGKTASCVSIRLHWNPKVVPGPQDEATGFALDIPSDSPAATVFTARLWSASLAGAIAWQQPWQGAYWKILNTPATDGTGIDAGLAVGMVATSARRPYPKDTVVLGNLNPDGSMGPVSHLADRMNAIAAAGYTRVIIPRTQRFDSDANGEVVNMVRHAEDLHLTCIAADTVTDAIEQAMNDPLPEMEVSTGAPKYSNEVASFIDDFAHREQDELTTDLRYAPKDGELAKYPPRQAALWHSIYADMDAGQQAYRAGQVYIAYRLFARANARMHGVNALGGQTRAIFDVKASLAQAADLSQRLHDLITPPAIDKNELQSAVLVAEMGDWGYDIMASLEDAQLVTKQAYSQRTDATDAEKDRARETILFALEQSKYLLNQVDFFTKLQPHIGTGQPRPVDENAARLLPQLIPAELATAQTFTDGIRFQASALREGLLFDARLAAYVKTLRETQAEWNSRQRRKEIEQTTVASAPGNGSVKPDASDATGTVSFDAGTTYAPPHTLVAPTTPARKLSDVARCLVWVNHDCEIATLDEKYLRLNGAIDPVTHEWHVKDRAKLNALLDLAETGARRGIAFAENAGIDSSVFSMIYERAAQARIQEDDAAALDALRNYWRCGLLGMMCWQLAHAPKAEAVDLATENKDVKPGKKEEAKVPEKAGTAAATNTAPSIPAPPVAATNAPATNEPTAHAPAPPVANDPAYVDAPRALPVTDADLTNAAPAIDSSPIAGTNAVPVDATIDESKIPVAPIANKSDYSGGDSATNAAPVAIPVIPATNP